MRWFKFIISLAGCLLIAACDGSQNASLRASSGGSTPLLAVTPNVGPIAGGTKLSLTGVGFAAGMNITIGAQACLSVAVLSTTMASCVTPPASTPGVVDVVVILSGIRLATATSGFTYMEALKITEVAPSIVKTTGRTSIELRGHGFVTGATVDISGTACDNPQVSSPTSLTCMSPASTLSGPAVITVTNPGGDRIAAANLLIYKAAPSLSSIEPAASSTEGGSEITITGTGFDEGSKVRLGDRECDETRFVSEGTLVCKVPAATVTTVEVMVVDSLGQMVKLAEGFSYVGLPKIQEITPGLGSINGGEMVTINGEGFSKIATVFFGKAVCAPVTFYNSRVLTCVTPAQFAGVVDVLVDNGGDQRDTAKDGFTYGLSVTDATLTLTSLNPTDGLLAGGTQITLTGTGFSPDLTVKIGDKDCTKVLVASPTTATCVTPAGSEGRKDVIVTMGAYTAGLGKGFMYRSGSAPTMAAVTPNFGPIVGGTTVLISGSGFATGAEVKVGGQACATVVVTNSSSLSCATPKGSYGTTTVEVTNPDGQSVTLSNAFTYGNGLAPSVNAVTPNFGPAAGGTTLTITGVNFETGAVVTINGAACRNINVATSTSITCATPPGAWSGATEHLVQVTNPDGYKSSALVVAGVNSFAYNYGAAPTFTSIVPNFGPVEGNTLVAITGSNFVADAIVTVSGQRCTNVIFLSSTSITCRTPAGAWGLGKSVQVINPDGQTNPTNAAWNYSLGAAPSLSDIEPAFGSNEGGTTISISGSNFASGAIVQIGTLLCNTVTVSNSYTITCVTPASSFGAKAIKVINPDGQNTDPSSVNFTYGYGFAPSIAGIFPPTGPVTGNTLLHISGGNFVIGMTAYVDTVTKPCITTTIVTSTLATCLTPVGALGPARTVGVVNPDGGTASVGGAFTYQVPNSFLFTNTGSMDGTRFGSAVVGIPDLTADGIADYAVSEPYAPVSAIAAAGKVYVYNGASGALVCVLTSPTPVGNGLFGAALAAGRIDNEVRGDLVVGEPGQTVTAAVAAGKVHVFGGLAINTCTGGILNVPFIDFESPAPHAGGHFGHALAVGKITGTNQDILVGEPNAAASGTQCGRAIALIGVSAAGASSTYDVTTPGGCNAGGQFGYAVALADVDGDGKSDLVVGEPGAPGAPVSIPSAGKVYAINGANGTALLATYTGSNGSFNRFGSAVANAGYLTPDLKEDLVVGEPNTSVVGISNVGKVYVFRDITTTALVSLAPATNEQNSLFGLAVASAGDIDGDGRTDFMIGQPYLTGTGNTHRGRLVIYSGQAATLGSGAILQTFEGTSVNGQLGRALAPLGDINNDGVADIIFGEPYAPAGGNNRGRSFVWLAP